MSKRLRSLWRCVAAVVALTAVASGCGESSSAKIGLLLPEQTRRFEAGDRPDFESAVTKECSGCTVVYANAKGLASRQQLQGERMLKQGVEALVIDPVDTRAAGSLVEQARADEVPVISYDRLVEESVPTAYVAYDDIRAGELQVESLAHKLREAGKPHGPVMVQNGEPVDRDYSLYRKGALTALRAAGIKIASEHSTPFWASEYSADIAGEMIQEVGRAGFVGAYAATDGVALGTIRAMERAGIDPGERPTTGGNATPAGLRRIVSGRQYMTTYKPTRPEAAAAAKLAVTLAEGEEVPSSSVVRRLDNGIARVPSALATPVVVTKANIEKTVLADGFVTRAELCQGQEQREAAVCRG